MALISLSKHMDEDYVEVLCRVARGMDIVLESSIRKAIYGYTISKGFAIFNEIWRVLGRSKATVQWHIEMLKRCGVLEEIKLMKYRIVYAKRFEHVAIKRFLCERKPDGSYRWEKVRRVLMDLCYSNDCATLASRYGLSVEEVEGLRNLLLAYVDGAKGALCARKLAKLASCTE